MKHETELPVQYSGPELEGRSRDVTTLGKVIAQLRFERAFEADTGLGSDQARTLAQLHDEHPDFRSQLPAVTQ